MNRRRAPTPPGWWHDPAREPPWPARALAGLYGGVTGLRRRLYARGVLRQRQVPVPVVVVGGIVAGGSGKTPLVLAIIERLRAAGWTPGVATRGYGRDKAGEARWVQGDSDPALAGDEPLLLAQRSGVRVRADRDRVAAARALADAGCDIVVCDDGLQHYRLARDVEIEVIDGRRRYGNARLLPAGPLREPPERGATCDFRVLNLGTSGGEAGFGEWPMQLRPGPVRSLIGGRPLPLTAYAGHRVHAVAGIGDPERFFSMLRYVGIGVVPHPFPDHHVFMPADFDYGNDLPVLMTEKDAVKCAGFDDARLHVVPVQAQLPEAFWIALLDRVANARVRP
ncbi:MAG: tetraacyldisaccharide 4'-kinase [Pseudoxanthomonas suwonensis]|nr:tetraacyldisaccharide 4'-kinase [Pseudoxanthomonas suwonensis]